jgi:transposase
MVSLLVTYRLQDVDPYTYVVDVLDRVSVHPDKKILDPTPRMKKEKFSSDPL